ncbi:hypothetical protein Q2R95_004375 [Escherichia coli]|nr:hypothetical protein [Escherichia coli]HDV3697351.1 hypothetical protein [Escherichia coli]
MNNEIEKTMIASDVPLDAREREALKTTYRALCEIRRLASNELSDSERRKVFELADAVHNIPSLLAAHVEERKRMDWLISRSLEDFASVADRPV